jgi:seryl-tRNA synthetase/5'/3'-nucleotidase SurE
MHDIRFIRENPAAFDAGLKKRNLAPLSAELLEIDKRRRAAISESEAAQAQRKALSRQIGIAKGKGEPAEALMAEVAALEATLKKGEAEAQRLDEELTHRLEVLPNLPFDDVPDGTDETGNVEVRRVGSQRNFAFQPKDHVALGEATGEMDFASAAKISGARFVFLKKHLARLERAIAQFMLDLHTSEEGGYTEVNPPLLVRDNAAYGVGQLPKFAEDMFHTDNGFWLVPTAEVPLTNLVNDTIVEEKDLPLRFTAFTPCFRSEAGAAGKDTRGMIRQHQFPKVELVSVTTPEQSDAEHQRMTSRRGAQEARPAVPHHRAVRRRHGAGLAQDLRYRSLAARPERLSRDLQLLELRRVPGAPHERALPAQGGQRDALRAHAERLGFGDRPHLDRDTGELPERGRLGDHSRGAAALHGWADGPAGSRGQAQMTPAEIARKRILVTNDDGINAPGLEAMIDIATQLSQDVWVVAPEYNQSGAGHSLSLTHPVRARQLTETKYALEGTPTDCVLFAVKHLLKDHKPDIVLSGVNRGGNMSDDVTYSGTIAGAMEGCLLGIPSIAFSQTYTHPHPVKWDTATQFGADVARRALAMSIPHNVLINVNFPDVAAANVKGVRVTRQGVRGFGGHIVERTDPRGGAYYWIAYAPGEHEHDDESDLTSVRSGYVSVTPLHLDLTHEATRRKLAAQFAD